MILLPDLLYRNGAFEAGLALEYDPAQGRIVRIGSAAELTSRRTAEIERLPGRALLPGFVNAHSHAFQRLLRGRTQWRPAGAAQADFWSWREAMYAAAFALSPEDLEAVARFCFLEMLLAGITCVGEFHYLRNDPAGNAYSDPNELAQRVLAAARDVGIRIVLLNVCYATGGISRELAPEQRRFATPELDQFLADTDALRSLARDPLVSVGLAPHSVRAVPRAWLRELHAWAAAAGVPLHMHVSEQPAEVAECLAAHGLRPVELLAEEGLLDASFTAVHATHLAPNEIGQLANARVTVCACPTTERDLGDGFLPGLELLEAGVPLALGTDSQTQIDMFEELRLLEFHERLRRQRRVVLAEPAASGRLEAAPRLLSFATTGGARSLRGEIGRLAPGAPADFVAIDLEHVSLAGWTVDSLPAAIAFSAPPDVVSDVWVGGTRRVQARQHHALEDAARAFRGVAGRTRP